jgi:hypothetical protein
VVSLCRKWRTKKLICTLTHDVTAKLTIFQGTVQEERPLFLSPPPPRDTPFGKSRPTNVWPRACVRGGGGEEYKSSTETASDVTNLRLPYKKLIFIRQWNDDACKCPSACTVMECLRCDTCNFCLYGNILYSLSENIFHEYVKLIKQAHCRVYWRTILCWGYILVLNNDMCAFDPPRGNPEASIYLTTLLSAESIYIAYWVKDWMG